MKYTILILPLFVSLYLLSFAKYNWGNRNKMAAIGAILMTVAVIVMPFFIL